MNKEIGGYFGLENSSGSHEYYKKLISLNTGRNALVYLFKTRKIKKLYIPFFLCDTIKEVCNRENIKYEQYDINESFYPVFMKKLNKNEFLYVVNYYGQLSKHTIKFLKRKFNNIILDNVQSFFTKPIKGIDTIYSCRKFFGVPDGSYLSTNLFLNETLEIDDSSNRVSHLYGRVKDGATAHYHEFKKNDESFYKLPLKEMSYLTHKILNDINYSLVLKTRTRNFNFLNKELKFLNELKLHKTKGSFCYPLLVKNGQEIREKLIKLRIYVPILWPNLETEHARKLANNILPIPCDQRYNKEDMNLIIREIKKCMKI